MTTVIKTADSVEKAVQQALESLQVSRDEVTIDILKEAKAGFLGFGAQDAVVRVSLKDDRFDELLKKENLRAEDIFTAPSFEEEEEEASSAPDFEEADEEEASSAPDFEEADEEEAPSSADFTEDYEDNDEEVPAYEEEEESPSKEDLYGDWDAYIQGESRDFSSLFPEEIEDPLAYCKEWMETLLSVMHIDASVNASMDEDAILLEIVDISETDTGIVIGRRAETLNAIQYIQSIAVNRLTKVHHQVYVDVGGYRSRRKASIQKMAKRNAEKVLKTGRPYRMEAMNAFERRLVHTALQEVAGVTTASEGHEPYRKVVIRVDE